MSHIVEESRQRFGADRVAESLGRRWRAVSLLAVGVLAGAGWAWLAAALALGGEGAALGPLAPVVERALAAFSAFPDTGGGHGLLMPGFAAWDVGDVALVLAMWVAMVFAMMLPTAAPTFRAYATDGGGRAFAVMAGYTAVWLGVAVVAAAGQGGLVALGALAPHMAPAATALSASVLIAAGVYQFTPLKRACLTRCRNPRVALLDGASPRLAFRVGVEEGLACLGCCWALMAVMFAAGLMNIAVMAALGVLMGIEKLVAGLSFTYVMGAVLLLSGFGLASGSLFG